MKSITSLVKSKLWAILFLIALILINFAFDGIEIELKILIKRCVVHFNIVNIAGNLVHTVGRFAHNNIIRSGIAKDSDKQVDYFI